MKIIMIPSSRARWFPLAVVSIAAAVCGLFPGIASAETSSYYLQTFNLNPDPNLPTANYALVTLTGDNTAGTVDVTMTTVFAGSFDSAAELNGIGFTFDAPELDAVTASNFSNLPTDYVANKGPSQLDGYGKFGWVVEAKTSRDDLRTDTFSFTITGLTTLLGAGWTLADVFDPNNGGRLFAGHYYPSFDNYPDNPNNTGWIDGAVPTPEPSTFALVGIGICSFLGFGKIRRRSAV